MAGTRLRLSINVVTLLTPLLLCGVPDISRAGVDRSDNQSCLADTIAELVAGGTSDDKTLSRLLAAMKEYHVGEGRRGSFFRALQAQIPESYRPALEPLRKTAETDEIRRFVSEIGLPHEPGLQRRYPYLQYELQYRVLHGKAWATLKRRIGAPELVPAPDRTYLRLSLRKKTFKRFKDRILQALDRHAANDRINLTRSANGRILIEVPVLSSDLAMVLGRDLARLLPSTASPKRGGPLFAKRIGRSPIFISPNEWKGDEFMLDGHMKLYYEAYRKCIDQLSESCLRTFLAEKKMDPATGFTFDQLKTVSHMERDWSYYPETVRISPDVAASYRPLNSLPGAVWYRSRSIREGLARRSAKILKQDVPRLPQTGGLLEADQDVLTRQAARFAAEKLTDARSVGIWLSDLYLETADYMASQPRPAWKAVLDEGHLAPEAVMEILVRRSRTHGWPGVARGPQKVLINRQDFASYFRESPFTDHAFPDQRHGVHAHLIQMLYIADMLKESNRKLLTGPEFFKRISEPKYFEVWEEVFDDSRMGLANNFTSPEVWTYYLNTYFGLD